MDGVSLEEKIKRFLAVEIGSGYGRGDGSGYGRGDGSGYGRGDGSGYGMGDGSGYGMGDGSGYGRGLKSFNGLKVHSIDSIETVILSVHLNLAKGFTIEANLTTHPCYIAKGNNLFAHGETAKDAQEALREKIFDNMDDDEKLDAFRSEFQDFDKKYPAKVFFDWHHRLTGSCEFGRNQFCLNHGINLDTDEYSVRDFVRICQDDYGGEIIKKILEA